jgi:hypothetical protein
VGGEGVPLEMDGKTIAICQSYLLSALFSGRVGEKLQSEKKIWLSLNFCDVVISFECFKVIFIVIVVFCEIMRAESKNGNIKVLRVETNNKSDF